MMNNNYSASGGSFFDESPRLKGIILCLIPILICLPLIIQYVKVDNGKSVKSSQRTKFRLRRLQPLKDQMSAKGVVEAWCDFWRKLPSNIQCLHARSFYIPHYRMEWGKYNSWHFSPKEFLSNPEEPGTSKKPSTRRNKPPFPIPIRDRPHEKHSRHNHTLCEIITICVAGVNYQTQRKNLDRFPNTLLGNEYKRQKYYDQENRYYFFDRNRRAFDSVLFYYQSGGVLRRPDYISLDIFMDELKFYELDDENIARFRESEIISVEREPDLPRNLLKRKIWCLFDFGDSSIQARIVSLMSVIVVIISLVTFCVETLPVFEGSLFIDKSASGEYLSYNLGIYVDFQDPFNIIEAACIMWFCFEIIVRYASCPDKGDFFSDLLNVSDLLSIIPWFVSLFTMLSSYLYVHVDDKNLVTTVKSSSFVSLLKAVRLVRVFRILKLSRHSSGLKILGKTLHASVSELSLLVLFVMIGVVLFSSMMYFAELGHKNTPFVSIPTGFWWGVCTMTTVGYGDQVPVSTLGQIVGSLCAVAGVLTIALPVPVIVNNFTFFYRQHADKQELNFIQTNHVENCPYRLAGFAFHKVPEEDFISEYELFKHENKDQLKEIRDSLADSCPIEKNSNAVKIKAKQTDSPQPMGSIMTSFLGRLK